MTRIANLAETTEFTNDDVLVVSDGQLTRKITVNNFKTAFLNRASRTEAGIVRVGAGLEITEGGVLSVRNFSAYTLPQASVQTLGGIRVGPGLEIDSAGILRTTYTLPVATQSILGGVKVGSGVVISPDGALSVDVEGRDMFPTGVYAGPDNEIRIYVEGITARIREQSRGLLDISVVDSEVPSGFSNIRLLSTLQSQSANGPATPALVPGSVDIAVNLGFSSRKWNEVYANTVNGNLVGNVQGNTVGTHRGDVYAADESLAYNATNKEFNGSFIGDLAGNATTANRLQVPRKINNVFFNGTSDITVFDDTKVAKTGDSMSGLLLLSGNPVAPLHATPKQYVDNRDNLKLNLTGGTLTGFLTLNDAPQTAMHAATKDYVDGVAATKLNLSGGALSGPLLLHADPVSTFGAATKRYVDNTVDTSIAANNVILTAYIDSRDSLKLNLTGGILSGFLSLHADPSSDPHATTKRYVDTADTNLNSTLRAYTDAAAAPKVNRAGDTLTGFLSLHSAPIDASHATTKQYVDAADTLLNATLRSYIDARDNTKVDRAGDTLSGFLTLHSNPTANLHAVTKQYVDSADTNLNSTLRAYAESLSSPKVNRAGDTLSGFLTLHSNPTANLHAVTKQYVDSNILNLNDVLRSYIDSRDNTKLNITGGTLTGFLTLHSAPTLANHAATKAYVDSRLPPVTYWAGRTTVSNVAATYVNFPAGTKVAFWDERAYYAPANSNGGSAYITDWFRRVLEKTSSGSWVDVGA
jgi:hypothetical protein